MRLFYGGCWWIKTGKREFVLWGVIVLKWTGLTNKLLFIDIIDCQEQWLLPFCMEINKLKWFDLTRNASFSLSVTQQNQPSYVNSGSFRWWSWPSYIWQYKAQKRRGLNWLLSCIQGVIMDKSNTQIYLFLIWGLVISV